MNSHVFRERRPLTRGQSTYMRQGRHNIGIVGWNMQQTKMGKTRYTEAEMHLLAQAHETDGLIEWEKMRRQPYCKTGVLRSILALHTKHRRKRRDPSGNEPKDVGDCTKDWSSFYLLMGSRWSPHS